VNFLSLPADVVSARRRLVQLGGNSLDPHLALIYNSFFRLVAEPCSRFCSGYAPLPALWLIREDAQNVHPLAGI
jgi:hypothetical protein